MAGPSWRGAQYGELLYLGSAEQPFRSGDLANADWFPGGDGGVVHSARAVAVGLIIKWFDWLYLRGNEETNRYKAAILHSFCFGAIFNMIVLAREGLDSFVSRVVFFMVVFGSACCWPNCCTGCLTAQGLCTSASGRAAQRCRKSE
jgi:hypothetical protein